MTAFRIGEAAELLGVSVDTVRRWVDAGRLGAARDDHGHRVIEGADLAGFVRSQAAEPEDRSELSSARNDAQQMLVRALAVRWPVAPVAAYRTADDQVHRDRIRVVANAERID